MEALIEIVTRHAPNAHWYVFVAIILAGFNIPISADVLILLSAFIAATIVPEHTWHLFFAVLFGCYFSAMCAYWVGRLGGSQLQRWRFFATLFHPGRVAKIRNFYDKYGFRTLILGRFIPFGIRNCIFMTAGMSKMQFHQFILRDALACSIWCGVTFYLFYTLGQNYQVVWQYLKTFNLVIFTAFSVTVIAFVWYNNRKKMRSTNPTGRSS
jgi:membrane-associated protein